jgi:hypothetical protein
MALEMALESVDLAQVFHDPLNRLRHPLSGQVVTAVIEEEFFARLGDVCEQTSGVVGGVVGVLRSHQEPRWPPEALRQR